MPVTEQRQAALSRAHEVRLARAAKRRALRGASAGRIEKALLDSSDVLGTYSLEDLLSPGRRGTGIVRGFAWASLVGVCQQLRGRNPKGRKWDPATRIRDLTERERRELVDALSPYLPGDVA